MVKRYSNVSDLVRDVAPDQETYEATEKRIAGRMLVKHLMAARSAKALSQQDIAKMLDCTQSRISKLEKSLDDDVRLGDLRAYAAAVGHEFMCGLRQRDMKPVDAVKCHVFSIKRHMDNLAGLARKDEAIAQEVASFFAELFFNFARLFGDSVKQLPRTPNDEPYLDFQMGQVCSCQQEHNEMSECRKSCEPGHTLVSAP